MKLMKQLSICFVMVGVILSLSFPALGQTLFAPHSTNVVGTFIQVKVDTDGDIHLCYWRGYQLFYLHQDNRVFQPEMLVNGADYIGRDYPSFVVDADQNAHFAWQLVIPTHTEIWSSSYIKATKSWTDAELVIRDTFGDPDVRRPTMSICPNGDIFVASEADYSIKYNWKPAGGSWQVPVNPGACILSFSEPMEPVLPDLACGANNRPVCVFSHFNQDHLDLGFSQWEDGYWPLPMRPTQNWQSGITHSTSIAVDPELNPHFVWIEWREGGVHYDRIGYNYRNGPNFSSPWEQEKYIFVQSRITNVEMTPAPRIAINSRGDICVIFGRLRDDAYEPLHDVHFIFKAFDKDWPSPYELPPRISDSAKQGFPAVTVDPSNDFFVMAWEDNPPSEHELGTVYYRKLCPWPLDYAE